MIYGISIAHAQVHVEQDRRAGQHRRRDRACQCLADGADDDGADRRIRPVLDQRDGEDLQWHVNDVRHDSDDDRREHEDAEDAPPAAARQPAAPGRPGVDAISRCGRELRSTAGLGEVDCCATADSAANRRRQLCLGALAPAAGVVLAGRGRRLRV